MHPFLGDDLPGHIIAILAKQPFLTVPEIRELLFKTGKEWTPQRLYQVVQTLVKQQILVHVRRRYALQSGWLLDLAAWTQGALSTQMVSGAMLPLPGKSLTTRFSTLTELVSFWNSILLLQFSDTGRQAYYEQIPHAWFHLVNNQASQKLLKIMKREKRAYNLAVLGSTALDRTYRARHAVVSGVLRFGVQPIKEKTYKNRYLGVMVPYVTEVTIGPKLGALIDGVYNRSERATQNNVPALVSMLLEPGSITFRLSNDMTKAVRLYEKFTKYFGKM